MIRQRCTGESKVKLRAHRMIGIVKLKMCPPGRMVAGLSLAGDERISVKRELTTQYSELPTVAVFASQ